MLAKTKTEKKRPRHGKWILGPVFCSWEECRYTVQDASFSCHEMHSNSTQTKHLSTDLHKRSAVYLLGKKWHPLKITSWSSTRNTRYFKLVSHFSHPTHPEVANKILWIGFPLQSSNLIQKLPRNKTWRRITGSFGSIPTVATQLLPELRRQIYVVQLLCTKTL